LPVGGLLFVVLEGTVLDEFGIEAAISSVVDVFEEDAISAHQSGGLLSERI